MTAKLIKQLQEIKLFEEDLFTPPTHEEAEAREKIAFPYDLNRIKSLAQSKGWPVDLNDFEDTIEVELEYGEHSFIQMVFRYRGQRCQFYKLTGLPHKIFNDEDNGLPGFIRVVTESGEFLKELARHG